MNTRWVMWIAMLGMTACKGQVGVSQKAVQDKIKSAFAAKGLELKEVRCPEGTLSGEVECTGVSPEGTEAPIVVNIEREGFLKHDLKFQTRGVAVGSVVAEKIAGASKDKYGVALTVTCPTFVKETEAMVCSGEFEGSAIEIKYQNGSWETTKGVVNADIVAETVARIAGVDRAGLECGAQQKVYGLTPGRKITCRTADREITAQVNAAADGLELVAPPATP